MSSDAAPPPIAIRRALLTPGTVDLLAGAAALLGALAVGVAAARVDALRVLLSPAAVAALLAALALSLAIVRSPAVAATVLATAVFLNLSQALVRSHALPSLLQLLAIPLLAAAWRARGDPARRRALASPAALALVAYALVLLASTTWARDAVLADARVTEQGRMLVIFGLAATLGAARRSLRAALWAAIAAGALLSLLALWQVATGDFAHDFWGLARSKQAQVYGDVFERRVAGPLGDPNFFAQLLLPLLPVALFVAWEERRRGLRALAFALAAVIVAATVFTYSRGAALALAVVIMLTLASHRTRMRRAAGVAVVLAVAVVAWLPMDFTRRLATVAQVLPGEDAPLHLDSSFEERRLLVRTASAMFAAHPALGVGAGNYTTRWDEYAPDVGSEARLYNDPGDPHYPHNLYLEIAAETGLVGLACFALAVGLCLTGLQRARRTLVTAGDGYYGGIARALQIGLVGHLVAALFLHGAFQRHVWLLFGLAAAVTAIARAEERA